MNHALQILTQYGHLFTIAGALFYIVNNIVSRLRTQSKILSAAKYFTEQFYADVDDILSSDRVPDQIKVVLYDLLEMVTDASMGRAAYSFITATIRDGRRPNGRGRVAELVDELRQRDPDLADKVVRAIGSGAKALILGHCHGDGQVVDAMERTQEPIRIAELLERLANRYVRQSAPPPRLGIRAA